MERMIDMSEHFEKFLTPEALRLHQLPAYSTCVEYNKMLVNGKEVGPWEEGYTHREPPPVNPFMYPREECTDYVRRVALVQFLIQPCAPISLQMELVYRDYEWTPAQRLAKFLDKQLRLMARVFNRCVNEKWLALGTWCKCTAVPINDGFSTVYHLAVCAAAPMHTMHELNAKLDANLFVFEGHNGDPEAWQAYARLEKYRREQLGKLPEDANTLEDEINFKKPGE